MYKVKLSNKTLKQLDNIPKHIYLKIYNRIKSLSSNPRPKGCIKLTDLDGYRIRIGNYRIVYEINDKIDYIEIFGVLHRKDAYKRK